MSVAHLACHTKNRHLVSKALATISNSIFDFAAEYRGSSVNTIKARLIPRLKAPIVLVHGLFGFDRIELAGLTVASYFPGVSECLQAAGNRLLIPRLHPTGGVSHRAQELKDFLLRESPHEPVHILAHSMGGLDARYMISKLGMAERVLSLTTLGTPHRGTTFVDWVLGKLERMVRPALKFLDIPHQAFYDLTTTSCRKFNEQVTCDPRVRYYSVAARHDGSILSPEWLLPYYLVYQAEGDNDGVVSAASAQFGEGFEIWEGDHFSLVNWLHPIAKNRTIYRDPAPLWPADRTLGGYGLLSKLVVVSGEWWVVAKIKAYARLFPHHSPTHYSPLT